MTAWDAIRWVDEKKHNVYSVDDKLLWLSQVEQMASQLRQRCGLEGEGWEKAPDAVLTIPEPYDQLYLRWLEAQIDYTGQEYLKYNNAMAVFSALWQDYANFVRRSHAGDGRWQIA